MHFSRLILILFFLLSLPGCSAMPAPSPTVPETVPSIPPRLSRAPSGEPELKVYIVKEKALKTLPIEDYVARVLSGEMANDWPMEALKAQAVLARTFVMKFVSEKESRYEGADISSDIQEAQAYDEAGVNDRIRQAVSETRGQVLAHGSTFPYAWFHAHSGGTTALAQEGLDYRKSEPDYTRVSPGHETNSAPENTRLWQASFAADVFAGACRETGVAIDSLKSVAIEQKGPSGRVTEFLVNDKTVPAAPLRLALGSTIMRSTLLTALRFENGQVFMTGKGYGHGVGMSQWGAYALAEAGQSYEEIILSYFDNVRLVTLW